MAYTLGEFIEQERIQRDMSMRDFARKVGVSEATISKHIAGKGGTPREEFLVKLCNFTGANLEAIFALAYPDVAAKTALSPRAILIAQRLDRLPESVQDFILRSAVSE